MLVTNRKELTTSLVHADNFGPKNHRNYAFSSYLHVLSSSLLIDLSSSRLPDTWYSGKGGGGGKKEKAALPPPSFLPFYFRFRAFSFRGLNHLGAWKRLIYSILVMITYSRLEHHRIFSFSRSARCWSRFSTFDFQDASNTLIYKIHKLETLVLSDQLHSCMSWTFPDPKHFPLSQLPTVISHRRKKNRCRL